MLNMVTLVVLSLQGELIMTERFVTCNSYTAVGRLSGSIMEERNRIDFRPQVIRWTLFGDA